MTFTKRLLPSIVAIGLVAISPSIAAADWMQNGIVWRATPSGSSVGECFGNCGAGCGDFFSPCGGPRQYWALELLAGPDLVGTVQRASCTPGESGNEYFEEIHEQLQAIGRWTYHGYVAPGCIIHDFNCNDAFVGCVIWGGCGGPGWSDKWSYDEWMIGLRLISREYIGPC